jgi:hypothetical protein
VKFPAERTMLSLAAIVHGVEGEATDCGRLIVKHDRGLWEVFPSELDTLESLGLVRLEPTAPGDDANTCGVSATDRGRYWHSRWDRLPDHKKRP